MNPKHRYVTGIGLLAIFLGLLVWDVFLFTDGVPGNTISEVLGELTVAGLLAAYLAGHFWPQERLLALAWKRDLSVLSLGQLKDMRIAVDRQIGAKDRG